MLAMAYLVWHHLAGALYGMAAAALALLFIGIHNAWDIAVWMTLTRPGKSDARERQARRQHPGRGRERAGATRP